MASKFFGRYEVLEKLGEGAQSVVHRVRDTLNQDTPKALKILKADYFKRHDGQDLIREFQLLESVDHENLVRVFECRFLPEDKAPVLVTEFIEGAATLDGFLVAGLELSFADKIQITYQALSALRYLHRKKIVHGDLKPSNILLIKRDKSANPVLKLIDFGVSQDLVADRRPKRAGTPYYLAPEVMTKGVSTASDLYSLGVILYRLFVSAALPYQALKANDILAKHAAEEPLFSESVFQSAQTPPLILDFIRQCLAPDPLERPRNLARFLSLLRFEYAEILGQLPPPSADTRLRQYLSGQANLFVVQRLLREHFQSSTESSSSLRHVLCAASPSGGGKSRFLHEVGKACQKDKINHLFIQYVPRDFWDYAVTLAMREFSATKTTKRMRGRILEVLKSPELAARLHLFSQYFNNLGEELGGLVLLIDGLGSQIPSAFVDILKAIAKSPSRKRSSAAKIISVLSVSSRPLDDAEDSFKLTELVSNINQAVLEERTTTDRSDYAQAQWRQIPEQIRALGLDGTAHLFLLPPWGPAETKIYLSEVFPEKHFPPDFIAKLASLTHGNPGMLQAIAGEALALTETSGLSSESLLHDLLLELTRNAQIQDLPVYRLKFYNDHGRLLLALLAAFELASREQLDVIYKALDQDVKPHLIRAFDDGLIQIDDHGNYFVSSPNLIRSLYQEALDSTRPLGFLLRKVLQQASSLLSTRETIRLAQFLGHRKAWLDAILLYFNEVKQPKARLEIVSSVRALRKDLETFLDYSEIDWDARLLLDYVSIEIDIMTRNVPNARRIGEQVLEILTRRNDAFANALRAKTQLLLGVCYRVDINTDRFIDRASELLQEAVDSDLLVDTDHYYALGNLALCDLYRAAKANEAIAEGLEYLSEARHELERRDPVRYAIITGSLGGFYCDQKDYQTAIPYLEVAARIFEQQGDVSRQIDHLVKAGRCHYFLGKYETALGIFERALPLAERLGLDTVCIDLLVFLIRTRYFMSDFRRFAPACMQLAALCERTNDMRPLTLIIEPAAHAYLEDGKIAKALELVEAQRKRLAQMPDNPRAEIDACICDLLLTRIYQAVGLWNEADRYNRAAHTRIVDMAGRERLAQDAQQVHFIYEVEMLRHDRGPKVALERLEELLQKNTFTGFNLQEVYVKAFRLAVAAEEDDRVQRYMPYCLQNLEKFSAQDRMAFYVDLGRHYLNRNELKKAHKALRDAARLLNNVTNHLVRANLYDQQARLASREGRRDQALSRWNTADKEFQLHLKTWKPDDKERFKQSSDDYKEHRVVFLSLQAA